MYKNFKTAVIIPCYRLPPTLQDIIAKVPDYIDIIIIIDDACPDNSVKIQLPNKNENDKVIYKRSLTNQGVGDAFRVGYEIACEEGVDLVVKIDGDGQHGTENINYYFDKIIDGQYDFMKGNRFTNSSVLSNMPLVRLIGNSFLSLVCKVTSGYWSVMDPTYGKFATSISCLNALQWRTIGKRYTFETSLICSLSLEYAKIGQVRENVVYSIEKSNLRPIRMIMPLLSVCGTFFVKRYIQKNFLRTFTVNTALIPLWLFLFPFTLNFVYSNWKMAIELNEYTAPGTVGIALLLSIITILLPVLIIMYDVVSEPKEVQDFLKLNKN